MSPTTASCRVRERKIKQIFVNLLTNAIKFTPAGGALTLTASVESHCGLFVRVSDTGIGIAEDDIPKVLQPFVQVDSDLNHKHEGTGLGLPLSKALVELHGGRLDLESEVGVGTTVTVRFRVERIVTPSQASASLPPRRWPTPAATV